MDGLDEGGLFGGQVVRPTVCLSWVGEMSGDGKMGDVDDAGM